MGTQGMVKLYYGSGDCTLESSEDIFGVEIRHKGSISINGTNNETRLTLNKNNKILI